MCAQTCLLYLCKYRQLADRKTFKKNQHVRSSVCVCVANTCSRISTRAPTEFVIIVIIYYDFLVARQKHQIDFIE